MFDLLLLAQDNPLLFGIIVFNILVGVYIAAYFGIYLYKRKHPEILLNVLLWKTQVRTTSSCSTAEDLYGLVMQRLRKQRVLSKRDGTGKLARDKSIRDLPFGEKDLIGKIYALYERKIYEKKPIADEAGTVRTLLDRLLSI